MGIIYKATNKINGKCYIGQTTREYKKRVREHLTGKNKCKFQYILQEDPYKFKWEILYECYSNDELNRMENYYIKYYDSISNGYNLVNATTKKTIKKDKMDRYWLFDERHKVSPVPGGHTNNTIYPIEKNDLSIIHFQDYDKLQFYFNKIDRPDQSKMSKIGDITMLEVSENYSTSILWVEEVKSWICGFNTPNVCFGHTQPFERLNHFKKEVIKRHREISWSELRQEWLDYGEKRWGEYYSKRWKSTNIFRNSKDFCPKCGSRLIQKDGPFGKFTGCSYYPKCKYSKSKNITNRSSYPNLCGKGHTNHLDM